MTEHVLIITRDFPWPETEGALQYSAQLLRALSSYYNTVDVLCPEPENPIHNDTQERPTNLTFQLYPTPPVSDFAQLFSLRPAGCVRKSSKAAFAKLELCLAKQPQTVVIDHHHSAWSTDGINHWKQGNPNAKILYVTHNEEFTTRLSIAAGEIRKPHRAAAHLLDAVRTYALDRKVTRLVDIVTCISSNDCRSYQKIYGVNNVAVCPPSYHGQALAQRTISVETERRACIVGSFVWAAKRSNLELFLRTGYTLFRDKDIHISIIGKMPTDYRSKMQKKWPGVEFTGAVDHIEPYLTQNRIGIIAEESGGGFKLKSLDYVFNRLPIYALKQSIVDLPLVDGESARLCTDMKSLCVAIAGEIDDFDKLNLFHNNAFSSCNRYVDTNFFKSVLGAAAPRAPIKKNKTET